jgi:hypothetical protein
MVFYFMTILQIFNCKIQIQNRVPDDLLKKEYGFTYACFSQDGNQILTASLDFTGKIRDVNPGKFLAVL